MSLPRSSAEISALYQEMILDHYRRPRNKGVLENADASVEMKNPKSVATRSGTLENDRIPVTEKAINRVTSYLVVPLVRGGLTNDTFAVRKPTH